MKLSTAEAEIMAGCLVDGRWGQYAQAQAITIAEGMGFDNSQLIRIAHKHLNSMRPNRSGNPDLSDREFEILNDFYIEDWLNDHVVPSGYSFGWHDGEFFLADDEWWAE
jgi:hypothetical protein